MTEIVVKFFGWIFSNLLGMSIGKNIPDNKFTKAGSVLAGVSILCGIAYFIEREKSIYIWIGLFSFLVCFWAMIKGFSVDID